MKVTVFFDGGTRVHHGISAGGAVVYDDAGHELLARARFLPDNTLNNVSEYTGLILGMEMALELGATEVQIFGDSELVVRQVDGRYQAKKAHLVPLRNQVWELGRRFKKVSIREIPRGRGGRRRDNNARADELCGQAMDVKADIN